ncbi:MAG: hypothetical protein ACOX6N_01120 [Patescibacteria group bacterium]|jgi:hypothetical protein
MKKEDLLYQNIDQPLENPLSVEEKRENNDNISENKIRRYLNEPKILILTILVLIIIVLSLVAVIIRLTSNHNPQDNNSKTELTPTISTVSPTPTQSSIPNQYMESLNKIDTTMNYFEKLMPPQINKELKY